MQGFIKNLASEQELDDGGNICASIFLILQNDAHLGTHKVPSRCSRLVDRRLSEQIFMSTPADEEMIG